MNGYRGGKYNTVVTLFTRSDVDDAIEYLMRNGYSEAQKNIADEEATGRKPTFAYNNDVSELTVPQSHKSVKVQQSETTDAEYMDAVNSGDTETAQRMADDAAKAAGYDIVGYYGSKTKGIRVFRTSNEWGYGGLYLASKENIAEDFTTNWANGEKGMVYKLYAKFSNPLVIDGMGRMYDSVPIPESIREEYGADYDDTNGIVRGICQRAWI